MSRELAEVLPQVHRYIDFLNQYNLLPAKRASLALDLRFQRGFAKTILAAKRGTATKPRLAGFEFSVTRSRSLTGKSHIAVVAIDRRLKFKRALTVFIGHRFTSSVTDNLRHNLQCVLRPYSIRVLYSDNDMPNGPVFQTILGRIKDADFCIFDDRETEARPNVFIELGAAIALGRPHFYLNFRKKRRVKVGRQEQRIQTPSDLAGMLYQAYSTYGELFLEFAMKLPGFLVDRKLAAR